MKTSLKVCNTKQLLIDGFNLMYKFPDLAGKISRGDLRAAMQGLLVILADYRKATGKKIRVVFDGKKESGLDIREERVKGIDVFYSIDITADSLIMKFIKNDPQANQVTVVSSDKEIVSYVNRFRAPFILSENFAELVTTTLAPKEEPELPEKDEVVSLSGEELSFWEKLFSRH
ncbi:MAG TPA: NYN domain-containing protein [Spirochaetota bacterium]